MTGTPGPPRRDPPALIQARSLFQEGKPAQARAVVEKYLRLDPAHPEANHSLAVILIQQKERERALIHAQRAAAGAPQVADYHATVGITLGLLGRIPDAKVAVQKATALEPTSAEHWLNLVPVLWDHGDFAAALEAADAGMAIDPVRARTARASVLGTMGEPEEAVGSLRQDLSADPGAQDVLSALAIAMNYIPADADEVFDVHRRFGAALERSVSRINGAGGGRDPDRKLKIGLISPDLYTHSVSSFVEPILRHLDRAAFALVCYSSRIYPDDTTARLKSLTDEWRDIAGLADAAIARRIADDAIDILIDLAGLTSGGSLSVMAARPAPVQITAIGYPNTTGLTSIDYRLVDHLTDPPESRSTERLVRVPGCFLCFSPPVPPTRRSTSKEGRGPTFGSFNTAQKINGSVIEAWARIVNSVPDSRLVLKAAQFACPAVQGKFVDKFSAAGLDPKKLELLPTIRDKGEHLSVYDRIDVALDPFPYNGTTTTCEAFFMGVPVVTLEGQAHAGRVGMSLLTAVGLPDLIAKTPEEYTQIASNLARDASRLPNPKQTLRDRMLASPLCDGPAYAKRLGETLRALWREHCSRH